MDLISEVIRDEEQTNQLPIAGDFQAQRVSYVGLWHFIICWHEQVVVQSRCW